MGRRMTCPACGSRTSSIVQAFADGEPCPSCGLPHAAAIAVIDAKAAAANREVTERAVRAEFRAAAAENELARAQYRLEKIAVDLVGEPPGWTSFREPRSPEILRDPDEGVESFLPDQG